MRKHRPDEPDGEVLPEQIASRLLTRASELDAAQRAGTVVAELRAAATEAGISPAAFEAALSELHEEKAQVPAAVDPRWRVRRWAVVSAVLAALLAIGTLYVGRRVTPTVASAGTVEEAFLLRCLTPGEAAELVRPILSLSTNTVVYSPDHAPRVLTVRATPEQLRNVRSVLERHEGTGSGACAARPAPAVPQ